MALTTLLIDCRMPSEGERRLLSLGYSVMRLPPMRGLPEAIESHPDTLIFKHGTNIITSADYTDAAAYIFSDLRELYPKLRLSFTADTVGNKYPSDARYNALVIGDHLLCNTRNVSEKIKEYASELGLGILHTNQGYPACSTLVLGGRCAISADGGIVKTLSEAGYETLLIKEGGISLPPYGYGFIGGATAVIGRRVFFFGDPTGHPSYCEMERFISERGYEIFRLLGGGLIDLGGITVIE